VSETEQKQNFIRPAWRIAAAVAGGLCLVMIHPTFDLWFLAWVAFVPLLFAIEGQTPRRSFFYGALFGAVGYHGGYHYLVYTIEIFGGFPLVISLMLYSLLCFACGIQFGVFAYLVRRLDNYFPDLRFVTVPCLIVAIEFLYPLLFPWTLGATTYKVLPLAQIADLVGSYGISYLIAFCNLLIYQAIAAQAKSRKLPLKPAVVFTVLLTLTLLYGFIRIPMVKKEMAAAPSLTVGLVQANIGILEKRLTSDKGWIHEAHNELSDEAARKLGVAPDLLVWPESSFRCWVEVKHNGKMRIRRCPTREKDLIPNLTGSWLIFGGLAFTKSAGEITGKYNTALLLNDEKKIVARQDKKYLLAFGEYMPLSDYIPALKTISKHTGDFTPAADAQLLPGPKGAKIASIICYEDIIPAYTRRLVAQGANLMINITNDAWFGKSDEPYQHLALSVFRSIENRRYLLRAVNTGVSAIIDPTGEIVEQSRIFEPATITGKISLLQSRTVYSYIGDIFAWLNCFIFFSLFGYGWRQSRVVNSKRKKKSKATRSGKGRAKR
jgi:apolipoprotein N-acyltransferase